MVLPLLAAGIGAAAGIYNASRQRKAQRKAEKRANARLDKGTDYVKMVANARKAGLNPLTVLRNGGSRGFEPQAPALAGQDFMAQGLSDAINTGFNMLANQPDPEREELEKDLLRAEVASLQENAKLVKDRDFGYSIPHVVSQTSQSTTLPRLNRDMDAHDPIYVNGRRVVKNDEWSDAQVVEDRYGDVISSVYGAAVIGADASSTLSPTSKAPRMRDVVDHMINAPFLSAYQPPLSRRRPKRRPRWIERGRGSENYTPQQEAYFREHGFGGR